MIATLKIEDGNRLGVLVSFANLRRPRTRRLGASASGASSYDLATIQSFPMPDISNPMAILLAQAVVSRSDLRWEFANIAAAVALLSVACAAIALFCFRPGTRDLTLIYFSLFCIFYAVRVLASLPSFRSLFDESPKFWNYLGWLVSSIIFFPGALYLYQVVGERLRKFLRWLLAARALYAVFEIFAVSLGVSLVKLGVANNIKVLATLVAAALFLLAGRLGP